MMKKFKNSIGEKVKVFIKDEAGEIGIKQIAMTVAIIVVIGAILTLLTGGLLSTWVSELWTFFMTEIKEFLD